MRRALVISLLAAVCLALGQCGRPSTPSGGEGASGTTLGQNLLVQLSGDLSYKRPGWKDYSPLTFGIALVRGDLLEVGDGASGVLVCADLSLAPLSPGYLGGVPCPDKNQVLTRGDSLVLAPQRGANAADSIPLLLQPRHTFVRDATPLIRWAPSSPQGSLYSVRVWGGDLDWQGQTAATELRYPADAPALVPRTTYRVTVTDDAGRDSDAEATALDLGFVLLSPEEAAAVDKLAKQAADLRLDEEAASLVESEILSAHNLRADAISILTRLADTGGAPAVFQRLGGLYLEVGLYAEAKHSFQAALSGFQDLGMQAWQAAALVGLGQAQRGDGDVASARQSLEQAAQLYGDLGDQEGLGRAEQLLQDLGND